MLVEVGPILKQVAREHGIRVYLLRDRDHQEARVAAMRALREAGLHNVGIARALGVTDVTVRHHIGPSQGKADAGSRCSDCGEVRPVTEFSKHAKTADGRGSWCHGCASRRDRLSRARTVRYRRRRQQLPGDLVHVGIKVPEAVRDLLGDTARRHRVTQASIIEKALVEALRCRDCRTRMRREGSDCCAECDRVWTPRAVAS